MYELFHTLSSMRLADALDIVMVALFFYGIFVLLRGSRSSVALMGFITIMVGSLMLFLVANTLNLQAMIMLFQRFWIVVVLIFLIVFQNEFKRALTDVGRMRLLRGLFRGRERGALDEVIQAAHKMSKLRQGALIVLERDNPLTSYMGAGTELDARVSSALIRTVFAKHAPIHDGALIVRGDRLVAAGCILPMTDDPELSRDLGTRHRAAIALSEETDAAVVVVSEETGTISLAVGGRIQRGLTEAELHGELSRLFDIDSESSAGEAAADVRSETA